MTLCILKHFVLSSSYIIPSYISTSMVCQDSRALRNHLIFHPHFLVFEVRVCELVLLFVNGCECVLGPVFCDDLHVERTRGGDAGPSARKDNLDKYQRF